jgi:ketosteroid isomerase-like protein
MSQENVEILARGYARFATSRELDEETTHPDFVWDMSTFSGWPERQFYEGTAGASEFLDSWTEPWDNWELELEELVDAGGDHVLAVLRQHGTSKTTGLEVDMRFAQLWTVQDGKIIRMRMYADPDEARQAAGPSD